MYYSTQYPSPVGTLTLASSGESIIGLWLDGQKHFGGGIAGEPAPNDSLSVFDQARWWLDRYFAGEQPTPDELPLSPAGSEHCQLIWKLLCQIPYGHWTTYGRLAEEAERRRGRPTCGRAVGSAVAVNPISIIIPCHRVLGARGKLTGYAGGLERKTWLLEHEGIDFRRL